MALTYSNYLKLPELLQLQEAKSSPPEHDEMLFIIIHQTYELWFKQLLHEMERLRTLLAEGSIWLAANTLKRMLKIMKTLVGQVDILETMTPLSFQGFRYYLETASGFQSVQFREVEILCGFRSPMLPAVSRQNEHAAKTIQQRLEESTIWEAYLSMLNKHGFSIPLNTKREDAGALFEPSEQVQQALLEIEKTGHPLSVLNELLVDFDEGIMEWRYRHVKLVQRTIGNKYGTGGSPGVGYLQKTLESHLFPDLWAIRSKF